MEPSAGSFPPPPPPPAGPAAPRSTNTSRIVALCLVLAALAIGAVVVLVTSRSHDTASVADTTTVHSTDGSQPGPFATGGPDATDLTDSAEFAALRADPQGYMSGWLDRYVSALLGGDLTTVQGMIGGSPELQARWTTPGVTELRFDSLQVTKVGEDASSVRLHVSYVVHVVDANGVPQDGPIELYWTMEDVGGRIMLTASSTSE